MGGLIDMRSSTVIAAGQIAVMVVGFALGVVVTLIVVIDQWSAPPAPTLSRPALYPRRPPPPAIALPPTPAPAVAGEPVLPGAAAPPKPAPAPDAPGGRYAVQAGAFLSQAAANAMSRRLDAAGHPTVVQVETDPVGRALNVVRLTETFETRLAAQAAARTLSNEEGVSTLIARLPAAQDGAPPAATAQP